MGCGSRWLRWRGVWVSGGVVWCGVVWFGGHLGQGGGADLSAA